MVMLPAIGIAAELCSLILGFLVIRAIHRAGAARGYFTLSVYVALQALCATVLFVYGLAPQWIFSTRREFVRFYWSSEVLIELLVLVVCLTLIHFGAETMPRRLAFTFILGCGSLAATLLSVFFLVPLDSPTYTPFMTRLASNLNFCTALLNFVLWGLLIRQRVKDMLLLLVSGGLGILTAGKAIGHSLRAMATAPSDRFLVELGNGIVVLTGMLCLFIWWRGFQRAGSARRAALNAGRVAEAN